MAKNNTNKGGSNSSKPNSNGGKIREGFGQSPKPEVKKGLPAFQLPKPPPKK